MWITRVPSKVCSPFISFFDILALWLWIPEAERSSSSSVPHTTTELADLDWHTLTVAQVAERLSVSLAVGLEPIQVDRKVKEHGKNEITPPSKNIFLKIVKYILGGFGPLLLGAAILCFIAW